MKLQRQLPVLALVALGAAAVTANASDREQVIREYQDALRNGDLVVSGETGLRENELYPQRYPARAKVARKTREQVQAELTAAQRSGETMANGEAGLTLAQLTPGRYPAAAVLAGRSRADVIAELNESRRTGDLFAGGEAGLTLREKFPQSYPAHARRDAPAQTVAQPFAPKVSTATH